MAEPFWTRHRGPYCLQVCRDTPTRKVKWHTESLNGDAGGPEAYEDACALLADPRDTITSVFIWSVSEEVHVCTIRRYDLEKATTSTIAPSEGRSAPGQEEPLAPQGEAQREGP